MAAFSCNMLQINMFIRLLPHAHSYSKTFSTHILKTTTILIMGHQLSICMTLNWPRPEKSVKLVRTKKDWNCLSEHKPATFPFISDSFLCCFHISQQRMPSASRYAFWQASSCHVHYISFHYSLLCLRSEIRNSLKICTHYCCYFSFRKS